jgi:hypothetical protein
MLLAFAGADYAYAKTVSLRQKDFHWTLASQRASVSDGNTARIDRIIELPHCEMSAEEKRYGTSKEMQTRRMQLHDDRWQGLLRRPL